MSAHGVPASWATGTGGRTRPRLLASATPAGQTAPPATASAAGTSSSSSQDSSTTSGDTSRW